MDLFEQELTRMMRDSEEVTPYEDRHRLRLQAGVRARRVTRAVWTVTGSLLAVAGLGVGLMVLPNALARGGPTGPRPGPVTSAESVPTPTTVRPASTAREMPVPTGTSATGSAPMPYRQSSSQSDSDPVHLPTWTSTTRWSLAPRPGPGVPAPLPTS
ncbi:hypothetical protein [Streptomyces graminilatus]|uniref:hypothetical protein n=1 Tax=Streptomyces graminilatus TaxID=1464070 RepID=UPI0006E2BA1B|nr:hypothetical protein [Streptomyces graminilatus]